jgi:hypothetical protein
VVDVSFEFWQHKLGRDPNVIGKMLMVKGHTFTIIGVAPRGFEGVNVGWGLLHAKFQPAEPRRWIPWWHWGISEADRLPHGDGSGEEATHEEKHYMHGILSVDMTHKGCAPRF